MTRLCLFALPLLGLASAAAASSAKQSSSVKRDLNQLRDEYDYIVVGGGTSGLVVANRLSEAPDKTVLVVEYGDFADTENATVPYLATKDQSARLYDMPSVPQAGLAGRTANLRIGKAVGGSSAVNGMAWDRGSAPDYDGWEALGNPGWGWEGLAKYFRRSSSFSPPADEYVSRYGYEWTDDAYGDGPIQVGYPSWQWPEAELYADAWITDLGVSNLTDGADGTNVGIAWLPQNSGGKEAVRSAAETAYYVPASNRTNLHLLVRHYGAAIKFDHDTAAATGLEIRSRDDASTPSFVASRNVILAAGAVNTPRLLQLSGVGPASLLESLGIDVVVDNPGVGANFQDHPSFFMSFEFHNDTEVNPDSMNDAAFYAAAQEEYAANRTGPLTHAWGNRVVFSSLMDLDPEHSVTIADSLADQDAAAHLPLIYAQSPSLLEGYLRQREVTESQFLNPLSGVAEITFGGSPTITLALQKPLSRGTILINSTDPDPSVAPLIDFGTVSNPVDMLLCVRTLQRARAFMNADAVAPLLPVEVAPGAEVESDAGIEEALRNSMLRPSLDHPVGTAAMMPREHGGVVDAELRVYGVKGVWVVDASMMPLLPAAHTQATVYAVAEYAADLIKGLAGE